MSSVVGDRVTLRPLRIDELNVLWEARKRGAARWALEISDAARDELRSRIASSGEFADGEILLAVDAAGRLIGDIQARQPRLGLPHGVFELGIEIFDPTDRGRGYGAEAITLFTSHLFETLGAHRVQATTDADNEPMRHVLERFGFSLEGVLRAFMPSRDGPPRDYAMYGMTRDDWENAKRTWTHPG